MERLEICNPDHIQQVRKYELAHGYNRITSNNDELREYEVAISAPMNARAVAVVTVTAPDETAAEELALAKVTPDDFEFDDISPDIDFADKSVDDVEEV